MIVFTGLGFLVLAITFGCSLSASLITSDLTGDKEYWGEHKWPLAIALICELSNEWLTGKIYLNMNSTDPPQS